MRAHERSRALLRAPQLIWDVLARGRYDFTYDRMQMSLRGMPPAKRWNLFRSGLNLVHRRRDPWSMPLHMQLELTNFCNLRCPVCPTGIEAVERPAQAMDPEMFERLMEQVGPYLLTASLWAWGEPLLHPQLKDILRAARRHDVVLLVSTNGMNLDRESVREALVEEPPTYLIVAIDGLEDATNSRFRVGARLEPILRGVRRLAAMKREQGAALPVLHMRFIVMRHNEHELPRVESFARENDFELLTIRTLSIIDTERPERLHSGFVPAQKLWRAYDYQGERRVHRPDFVCQQPFWFPTVLADGTVVACEQDYNAQQAMGRFPQDGSFANIWRSGRAAEARRRIRDHACDLSFCRNCPYADRATTDCSIEARPVRPSFVFPVLSGKAI